MSKKRNIRIEKSYTSIQGETGEIITYCSSEGTVAEYECPICKKWVTVKGLTGHFLIQYGCKDCLPPVED